MNPLSRLWHRLRARLSGRKRTDYSVFHDAEGLRLSWRTLEDEFGSSSLAWADVYRAVAYKRDLYTVDLICIAFFSAHDGALEIHEDMAGWQGLVDSLPRYLSGCTSFPEWWLIVAFPAFATSDTTIFTRNAAA